MALSPRQIALIAILSFLITTILIAALAIYIRRRRRRCRYYQNYSGNHYHRYRYHPTWLSFPEPVSFPATSSSTSSSSSSSLPPVKYEDRKQTHADRKVFSWFDNVPTDPDVVETWRFSMASMGKERRSLWQLTDEEMQDFEEKLEVLRGRGSVCSRV